MKTLKCVVVGCGDHANRFIYPALHTMAGIELAAVCARTSAHAEENRRRHGVERAYTDFREMFRQEKPDAAVIVGPPQLHYEAGLACVEAGIPFFIEKPLGADYAQARELTAAAAAAGVPGQVGFMMRHSAVGQQIRFHAVQEQLVCGTVRYFTSGPYRSDEIYGMPGRSDADFLRRYLMVQAVHPVNLAASLLGEIVEVTPQVTFHGENIIVNITLRDTAGRRMNAVLHTLVAPGYGNLQFKTELFFASRAMLFTDAFHSLDFYSGEATEAASCRHWQFAPFGSQLVQMGYGPELEYFFDSIRTGRREPGLTTLEDGLNTMLILDEVIRIFSLTE